jgi:hypothetical protein
MRGRAEMAVGFLYRSFFLFAGREAAIDADGH